VAGGPELLGARLILMLNFEAALGRPLNFVAHTRSQTEDSLLCVSAGFRILRPAVRGVSAGTTLRRLMILACFSADRPVRTSQEIGDLVGLLAVAVELLTAPLVGLGLIAEDAPGVYRFPGHAPYLEVKDQR
jgi:hypothetical protein